MTEASESDVPRRTILQGMAAGAASAALVTNAEARVSRGRQKKFVSVGCGSRARMFQDAIWGPHQDTSRLVGISDTNPGRMAYVLERAAAAGAPAPATYAPSDFNR